MITLRRVVPEDYSDIKELQRCSGNWLDPETFFDERDYSLIIEYSPKDLEKLSKKNLALIVFRDSSPIGFIEFSRFFGKKSVISWNVKDPDERLNESILKQFLNYDHNSSVIQISTSDPELEPIFLRNGFKKQRFNRFTYDFKRKKEEA